MGEPLVNCGASSQSLELSRMVTHGARAPLGLVSLTSEPSACQNQIAETLGEYSYLD